MEKRTKLITHTNTFEISLNLFPFCLMYSLWFD